MADIYTEFNGTNGTITDMFTYSAGVVPIFVPFVLFGFFIIALLSSYVSSMYRTGKGNFPGSFAVASWLTMILSIVFSLIPNFIRTGTVVVCVGLAILGTIILYVSKVDEGV